MLDVNSRLQRVFEVTARPLWIVFALLEPVIHSHYEASILNDAMSSLIVTGPFDV